MASISVQSIVIVIIQAFVQMVNRHTDMKTVRAEDKQTKRQTESWM